MLDLDARVHLEEEERAAAIEQALDRARADVADRTGSFDRHAAHALAQRPIDGRRGRLFEHLLVTALERAVALAEVDHTTVQIGEHLDLDVARVVHVLLDVDGRVGEVGLSLAHCGLERALGLACLGDDLETPTASARRGLDRDRPAVLVSQLDHALRVGDRLGRAGHDRHAGRGHPLPCADLRAHRLDRLGRRADPDEARGEARTREPGVLGEEPVAGMDRVGAALQRGSQHALDVQIALGRRAGSDQVGLIGAAHVQRAAIGLRVDRHRLQLQLAQGTEHADRDLAAVRDEDPGDPSRHRRRSYVGVTSTPSFNRPLRHSVDGICGGARC